MAIVLRSPIKIAVVGAPGTGKSKLIQALRLALQGDAVTHDCTVTENCALDQHRQYDLTLLTGLDFLHHSAKTDPNLQQFDADLRQALASESIAYTVVYGSVQARTDCALQAIAHHRKQSGKHPPVGACTWHWNCETCSDGASERYLFSTLVKASDSMRL